MSEKMALPSIGTAILRSAEEDVTGGSPARIVLSRMPEDNPANWATHKTNEETGGAVLGHYFVNLVNALHDYADRCAEMGIDRDPEILTNDREGMGVLVSACLNYDTSDKE